MATQFSQIDEIMAGRIDWKLKVRVMNMWNVPVRNSPQEVQTIEMVLIDSKKNKIGATIPKSWITHFMDLIKEGSTYLIENVNVAQNNIKYQKTTHKYKINFMRTTKISAISANEIPLVVFEFSEFPAILSETRSDLIVDVIGHIVEKDTLKEKEKDGRRSILLDVVLEDATNNRVTCTMWGSYARRMQSYLDIQDSKGSNEPVVVIVQMGRITKFLGNTGVSTGFYGTKLIINQDIPEITEYTTRINAVNGGAPHIVAPMVAHTAVSVVDEILNTPKMTIAELIESTKECFGSVLVTIVDINTEKGWSYNSCNKCLKAVNQVDNVFHCTNCRTNVTASPRFKLHLQVIDNTGSTTFTLFNSLVTTYVGRSAEALIRANEQRPNKDELPEEFNIFFEKEFLFKVQVADINVTRGWQTYTAKKFTADPDIIKDFIHRNIIYGSNDDPEVELQNDIAKLDENNPVIIIDDETPVKENSAMQDTTVTPSPKNGSKRNVSEIDGINLNNLAFSPESVNKIPKNVLKKEAQNDIAKLDENNPVIIIDDETPVKENSAMEDTIVTPSPKNGSKRNVSEIDGINLNNLAFSPESVNKIPKNVPKKEAQE